VPMLPRKILKSFYTRNFFVVNYGGHWGKQIKRINAQFVENDTLPIEEQYKRLMDFPLEPSIIVKTKKSLHSYWLLKEGDTALFRKVQKRLIEHFQGDKNIVNESRVLRLPGFFHCKGEPYKVECIKYNPELRYTQDQLLSLLPEEVGTMESSQSLAGNREGISLVTERCDFIQYCSEKAAVLSEVHWYAMITNLSVFREGQAVIHEISKPYPGYSKAETDNKIAHF
jgi:putative DNA primase/helicase